MKKIIFKPLAVAALASMGLFSCASSSTMDDTTAMDDDMSMSETQTMAGDTEADAAVGVDADMNADMDTDMEDIDYSEMFSTVDNTEQYDVISLAKMDPNLSTFVSLVEQADLADDLMQGESMTIFAPTNAAFAALPQDSLNMLMMPENKAQLIKVLQAHVLPTEVSSMGFNSSQRIETGGGEYVMIDVGANNSYVTVGGATIVKSDVEASNGVIHVVDKVINPTENVSRY